MEPNEIQAALSAAVEEVLETMCFTTVSAYAPGPPPAEAAPAAEALPPPLSLHVRFAGNPSGRFRLALPAALARVLAVAFLGREPREVSASDVLDVAGELTNMICGAVLSRLESESIFQITHPEPVSPGAAFDDCESAWFDLGDGVVTVSLQLQHPV